jgi:hypothetical protein
MWTMILSLEPIVDDLEPAFTRPSFASTCDLLLAWVMCLGPHTLRRVGHTVDPRHSPDQSQRHGLDAYYNFFARSAWTPGALAYRIAVLLLTRLKLCGSITLLTDDTLVHKRGKSVWGLGWFRDAVASTKKCVATASGHNWVVVTVAYCLPFSKVPILALPLLVRLHLPGKGNPSCATLVKDMLAEVLGWFPKRTFTLVGDGTYACKELLRDLDQRVTFVGRLRGDAALYDPRVPASKPGQRGQKAKQGPRLPTPKEAAAKADRKRTPVAGWLWQAVEVFVYGRQRALQALPYEAVWSTVLGLRPIQVVVVRDPEGRMRDACLFTTDLKADLSWVIVQFAWRWAIEVLFRASKQVMDIETAQHWSQESVEKLAPWVWSMQSVIMVWYITAGHESEEALEMRNHMGEWDSEWSLRHMIQVLRRAILNVTINPNSGDQDQLREMVKTLKNWANLAV